MKKLLIFIVSLLYIGPVNIHAQSKKQLKKQQKIAEYEATKKLVQSSIFEFEAHWATGSQAQRTNLSPGSKLHFNNKSTAANLPFIGISHSVIHALNNGINFSTTNTVFDIKYDDKKTKIRIKFEVDNKSEVFGVVLSIMSNGKASLSITSSARTFMNYEGKIGEPLLEEETNNSLLKSLFGRKRK